MKAIKGRNVKSAAADAHERAKDYLVPASWRGTASAGDTRGDLRNHCAPDPVDCAGPCGF